MYVLRLQTSIVWFLSLFSEEQMCMCKNFKHFCCAVYILNLIVSICLSCWPNLWCSGVFSAEFRSFRKNSANPDISRKYGSASQIFWKNPAEGSTWLESGTTAVGGRVAIVVSLTGALVCRLECLWVNVVYINVISDNIILLYSQCWLYSVYFALYP